MFYDDLKYDANGLICGVFQDYQTGEVLVVGWMNREAVQKTFETRRVWLYRRSKQKLMMKGEVSGNVQIVHEMRADCDLDALVIKIEQVGGAACAHGYRSCFYERITADGAMQTEGEPLFDPEVVYGKQ